MWGVGEASPSAKPVVFAFPLCVDTPQRPLNNPSLKGTVACKKDRQSQFHFVRCYPPDVILDQAKRGRGSIQFVLLTPH